MSFLILHHYLIEPMPQLVELVRHPQAADFAATLLRRVIVPKMHVKGHGADDANEAQIKLAYLSMIRMDTLWDSPEQFAELLGSSTLDVGLFDRWWTLAEVDAEPFEALEKFVRDALPLIDAPSDPRVAAWMHDGKPLY
jgi:hypothetical protein